MTDLLSPAARISIRAGFKDVADTFHKTPIIIRLRTATIKKPFGEGYTNTFDNVEVLGRVEPSKASGERYINVTDSPKGKNFQEGDKIFIWKDTLDVLLHGREVNPETDRVVIEQVEYEIRMFDVSGRFGDIGPMWYEMDLTQKGD